MLHLAERAALREAAGELEAAARDLSAALSAARGRRRGPAAPLEREPSLDRLHFRRFVIRAKMGDHRGAIRDLRRARSLDPCWAWSGSAHGDSGLPIWTLEHAISRHPSSPWLRAWRALERVRAGEGAAAASDMRAAAARGLPRAELAALRRVTGSGARPPRPADGALRAPPAPAEALEHLRSMGMLQDFLAVEHGLRPAAFYYDLPVRTLESLSLLCARSGLSMGRYRDPGTGDERTVWARDRGRLEAALADGRLGGQALPDDTGYPRCCVARAREILAEYPDVRTRPAYPLLTLASTRAKPPFHFLSNYLYHMENRDWGKRGLKGLRSDHSQYHLIPWTPCSFVCAESLRYAQRMLRLLADALPEFAARLTRTLRRPVLLWSDFEFAGLDASLEEEGLVLKGWEDPCGMLPDWARAALEGCARISTGPTGPRLLRRDGAAAELERPPVLFLFS